MLKGVYEATLLVEACKGYYVRLGVVYTNWALLNGDASKGYVYGYSERYYALNGIDAYFGVVDRSGDCVTVLLGLGANTVSFS